MLTLIQGKGREIQMLTLIQGKRRAIQMLTLIQGKKARNLNAVWEIQMLTLIGASRRESACEAPRAGARAPAKLIQDPARSAA